MIERVCRVTHLWGVTPQGKARLGDSRGSQILHISRAPCAGYRGAQDFLHPATAVVTTTAAQRGQLIRMGGREYDAPRKRSCRRLRQELTESNDSGQRRCVGVGGQGARLRENMNTP